MIACQALVQIYSTKEFGCHTVCIVLCPYGCVPNTVVFFFPTLLSIFFCLFVCMGTLVCLLTHDITSFFHCSFASAQHFCCWHFFFLSSLHYIALHWLMCPVHIVHSCFWSLAIFFFSAVIHQRSDSFVVCG